MGVDKVLSVEHTYEDLLSCEIDKKKERTVIIKYVITSTHNFLVDKRFACM